MAHVVNSNVDYTTDCCSDSPLALHIGVCKNILYRVWSRPQTVYFSLVEGFPNENSVVVNIVTVAVPYCTTCCVRGIYCDGSHNKLVFIN